MFKSKIDQPCSFIFNTIFGVASVLLGLVCLSLPANAGPQSLLDPYAEITPNAEPKPVFKKLGKPFVKHKEAVKQTDISLEETPISNNDASKELSSTNISEQKVVKKNNKERISRTNDSGFLSGIKEVQRGCVTSMKAAGGGIIVGSKTAGSKVAAGTQAIGGGIVTASQKVFPKSKGVTTKPIAVNNEKEPTEIAHGSARTPHPNTILPPLPGKPLDQVIAEEKERKHLKDVLVTGETKKPGIITSAVGKLKRYHAEKKQKASPNLTASNPAAAAR